MIALSVNVNKLATLRNARGGNLPNLIELVQHIEGFGVQGITVHPRPDQRHITYQDVYDLKKIIKTEFNIEGNPQVQQFIDLVTGARPEQVTLVPDAYQALTSNQGWDCVKHFDYLKDIVSLFQSCGIRVSIFIDPDITQLKAVKQLGADRAELYTQYYASQYPIDNMKAIAPYIIVAKAAQKIGLDLNAGHDLNISNVAYFIRHISCLKEVSIGHALICDALYWGLEKTIKMYLDAVKGI